MQVVKYLIVAHANRHFRYFFSVCNNSRPPFIQNPHLWGIMAQYIIEDTAKYIWRPYLGQCLGLAQISSTATESLFWCTHSFLLKTVCSSRFKAKSGYFATLSSPNMIGPQYIPKVVMRCFQTHDCWVVCMHVFVFIHSGISPCTTGLKALIKYMTHLTALVQPNSQMTDIPLTERHRLKDDHLSMSLRFFSLPLGIGPNERGPPF